MSFLQKVAPRDSITLAAYIAVVLFGLTLFLVRNKTKKIQWTSRIVFACVFLILALCRIF